MRRYLRKYDIVSPGQFATRPKQGMSLVNLQELGILKGIAGGAPTHGYHSTGDLITTTADGRDLNSLWSEFFELLNAVNGGRQALINFLTRPVTQPVVTVVLPGGEGVEFEEATEFGVPMGNRVSVPPQEFGFDFKWYDLAARFTWQFLANATSAQVESVANATVEAYYRKQLFTVLRRVFNPTEGTTTITGQPGAGTFPVYGFYNGDGTVPPPYKSNTFTGTHSHYKANNDTDLSPGDLDSLIIDDLSDHGYKMENGYRMVAMVHTGLANVIRGFRRGVDGARYDFIPGTAQPGQLLDTTIQVVGQSQLGPTLNGLTVIGNYGPLAIVEDDWLPEDYVFAFVTGGEESLQNPVGLRQHPNLPGLRLVQGRNPNYPLIDSYWATGFGTGVQHRGGGIVLQVVNSTTYTPPTIYA